MLTSLYIKNYALIDELKVNFNEGFTIITGETGAGKSILLGGLSLVLGKRADLSQVKNKAEKCIIEASFNVEDYDLVALFENLDLDYDAHTIIRREILPSGKSRAFINDTLTNLESLATLSSHLIDIHSQNQTQQLLQDEFQFKVIDALANNDSKLKAYSEKLSDYKAIKKSLDELRLSKADLIKEYDYNVFLINELNEIDLQSLQIEDLESQYEALTNLEAISEKLGNTKAVLNQESLGVIDQLNQIKQDIAKISSFGKPYELLLERLTSVSIELDDINAELDQLEESLISDPQALEEISHKLQILNNLFQKHAVREITELQEIKEDLESKISNTESLDTRIAAEEQEILKIENQLNTLASEISKSRKSVIPQLSNKLETVLAELGMVNAKFKIGLNAVNRYLINGKDELEFLFKANKGTDYSTLKKAASGGELSRIMLTIKALLSEYMQLPSIMFDEIDTGVSGEISNKMADIMRQMSRKMQVFSITHLPQIAAKGDAHYKVYKTDLDELTQTQLKQLNQDERIVEIAQMLGGTNITESAMAHAKQLLN